MNILDESGMDRIASFFGMAKKRGWISFEENNLAAKTDAVSGSSMMTARKIDLAELKGKVPEGKNIGRAVVQLCGHAVVRSCGLAVLQSGFFK